jgi:hypothetical protein
MKYTRALIPFLLQPTYHPQYPGIRPHQLGKEGPIIHTADKQQTYHKKTQTMPVCNYSTSQKFGHTFSFKGFSLFLPLATL